MKLYLKFFSIHFKSQMEYKASLFLQTFANFIYAFAVFAQIKLMFNHIDNLKGFSQDEILICFGIINLSFALAEQVFRAFDTFPNLIKSGDFDRLLVRPRNILFQILCNDMSLSRIGRTIQAIIVIIYVFSKGIIIWNFKKILLFILMIISGISVFSCLFLIGAAFSFITIDGIEFMNIFTDGGKEFGSYPLSIYGKNILRFTTYIIPLALVQYYPLLYLFDKDNSLFNYFSPILSFLFIIPSLLIWNIFSNKYESAGN